MIHHMKVHIVSYNFGKKTLQNPKFKFCLFMDTRTSNQLQCWAHPVQICKVIYTQKIHLILAIFKSRHYALSTQREVVRGVIWHLFLEIGAKVKNFLRLSHLQQSILSFLILCQFEQCSGVFIFTRVAQGYHYKLLIFSLFSVCRSRKPVNANHVSTEKSSKVWIF